MTQNMNPSHGGAQGAGLEQELKTASKEWTRRSKASFASAPDPLSMGSSLGLPPSKSMTTQQQSTSTLQVPTS